MEIELSLNEKEAKCVVDAIATERTSVARRIDGSESGLHVRELEDRNAVLGRLQNFLLYKLDNPRDHR